MQLTLWLLELVNEELYRVLWLVDDQATHHILKDLVKALLLNVLFTDSLEVNLLLFKHHLGQVLQTRISHFLIINLFLVQTN